MKLVITLATNASLTKYEVKMAEYRTSSFLVFKDQVEAQAPVVQTLDSAIRRINHYPADKYYGNQLRYPLDSDLSGG